MRTSGCVYSNIPIEALLLQVFWTLARQEPRSLGMDYKRSNTLAQFSGRN